ncbi:MAG TPA: TetR/AcrR family transcriptional regulator [Gaiellaceae bacterium]|nr:TetR/AcrR family transcriptional regulator [Gaiellaceae bacterium]
MPHPRAKRYHHGDLKAALIDGAVELIRERGVHSFSLAELSRRLGVTVAAPYRHFASRDELLAAVAVRALRAFGDALAARSSEADPPEQRLAAMANGYVRFAAEQPALFGVVFGTGLDKKKRDPQLRQAYEELEGVFADCVAALCPDDPDGAEQLGDAIEAAAHGYAALLTDQPGTPNHADVERAAEQAARATRALIDGRAALQRPT